MSIIRAAGRNLTVGELREAIVGLDDNIPVIAHDRSLELAVSDACRLWLDSDVEILQGERDAFRNALGLIANGGRRHARLADVRKRAAEVLAEYPG